MALGADSGRRDLIPFLRFPLPRTTVKSSSSESIDPTLLSSSIGDIGRPAGSDARGHGDSERRRVEVDAGRWGDRDRDLLEGGGVFLAGALAGAFGASSANRSPIVMVGGSAPELKISTRRSLKSLLLPIALIRSWRNPAIAKKLKEGRGALMEVDVLSLGRE